MRPATYIGILLVLLIAGFTVVPWGITIVLILILNIFIWVGHFLNMRSKSTDSYFSQNGVKVIYADKTISINGKMYPISAIRSISHTGQRGAKEVFGESYATIEVDDIKKPMHRIGFKGHLSAETFMSKLELALEKARDS